MPFNASETILDNLLARTKAEIDRLRKLLQADVKSNLNKADMAAEVADYIRHDGEFWIRRFPQRDIRIIRGLLSQPQGSSGFNAGLIPYPTALEKLGLIHAQCNRSGETIYRCTDEMYTAFNRGIQNASAAMHCMNYATYEQYLLGLTNIYGIVPYPMAYDIIIDAADAIETEKFDRQRNPFAFAHETLLLDLYTITVKGKAYVHNPAVFNPEDLLADINCRLDPHYYDNFLPAAPSFSHPELSSRHLELVSGSRNPIPAPLSSRAESRHAELVSISRHAGQRHPELDSGSHPTRKKFSLQTIFAAGATHDGYPFVAPTNNCSGQSLPSKISTYFGSSEQRHAELDSASPSLAAYIQFACWHTSVEYESPHKKKLNELIDKCPTFRADFKPSMDFTRTLMDYGDNIPIWSRLGYSYKEFYLKFGQPDPSTINPPTDYELFDLSSLRRKKSKK